jgi:anti-sigma factor RsiW
MGERNCIKGILLSEYLDGELAQDTLKNVEQHLADCPDCQAAYERMKAQRNFLIEYLPESDPPPDMKHRLSRRINAAPEIRPHGGIMDWTGIGRVFPLASRTWTFAGASIIFLAVLISAFQFQRYRENARILAEIDRSRAQWDARDHSINPFDIDIKGTSLQFHAENPFKPYLEEH